MTDHVLLLWFRHNHYSKRRRSTTHYRYVSRHDAAWIDPCSCFTFAGTRWSFVGSKNTLQWPRYWHHTTPYHTVPLSSTNRLHTHTAVHQNTSRPPPSAPHHTAAQCFLCSTWAQREIVTHELTFTSSGGIYCETFHDPRSANCVRG
jgi:hypothetical protein